MNNASTRAKICLFLKCQSLEQENARLIEDNKRLHKLNDAMREEFEEQDPEVGFMEAFGDD